MSKRERKKCGRNGGRSARARCGMRNWRSGGRDEGFLNREKDGEESGHSDSDATVVGEEVDKGGVEEVDEGLNELK